MLLCFLLFDCAGGDAAGQGALEEKEKDDARQHAQQGCGALRGNHHAALSARQRDRQRHRLIRVRDEKDQRQKEFVPGPDKEKDEEHGQRRRADRHDDAPQQLELVGAVDQGRFGQFTGEGRKDDDGKRIPMEVKVGDVVMYKKWGGTEIKVEGKDMLLVKEEDILAIVEE